MELDQPRRILSENLFKDDVSFLTQLNFFALGFKTLLKAPKVISDKSCTFFRMIRRSDYITELLATNPKAAKCWRYDEVNECHRELGIIYGYRNENCSFSQALLSLFKVTNETMNFWTHFLPSVYFMWLFYSFTFTMPLFSDKYYLPFLCYIITSCSYPLISCMAHAFSCLSVMATHVCFFMDYATLAVYSWGVAVYYYNYIIPHTMINSTYAAVFLPVSAMLALITTFMACYSRFLSASSSFCKLLRLGSFIIPYIWVSTPLIWRLFHCEYFNDTCTLSSVHHTRQFMGVLLAAFFYASHIPERFAPGRFDFVGHSHNLLHLFGIGATYEQLKGGIIDMEGRRNVLESLQWSSSPVWVMIVSPFIVIANIAIIVYFTKQIRGKENLVKKID